LLQQAVGPAGEMWKKGSIVRDGSMPAAGSLVHGIHSLLETWPHDVIIGCPSIGDWAWVARIGLAKCGISSAANTGILRIGGRQAMTLLPDGVETWRKSQRMESASNDIRNVWRLMRPGGRSRACTGLLLVVLSSTHG
jgi:hypothetical protein